MASPISCFDFVGFVVRTGDGKGGNVNKIMQTVE